MSFESVGPEPIVRALVSRAPRPVLDDRLRALIRESNAEGFELYERVRPVREVRDGVV